MAADATIRINIKVNSKETVAEVKQSAQKMTESVNKLGKNISDSVNKFDGSKLKKSINVATSVVGKLGVKFKGLAGIINNTAVKSIKNLGASFKNSATELLSKINLVKGAISAFTGVFKDLNSVYADAAGAEKRLEVSLKNNTDATEGQIDSVKKLAEQYQEIGVVSAGVQFTGLQELGTYISDAESMKKLLPILNDMTAQQYGFNASAENSMNIATALGKVLDGSTTSLKRYGYSFSEAQEQMIKYGTEQQRVKALVDVVSSSVGGMNQALGNTPEGKIKQLSNNFDDLKKELGGLLTYAILPIISSLNKIIIGLINAAKAATLFIKSLFGLGDAADSVVGVIGINNDATADSLDNTTEALNDTTNSAKKTKKEMKNLLGSFDELNVLADNSSDLLGGVDTSGGGGVVAPSFDLSGAKKIEDSYAEVADKIKTYFANIFQPIQDSWNKYGSGVVTAWSGAANSVKTDLEKVAASWNNVWTGGKGTEVVDAVLVTITNIGTAIDVIASKWGTVWDDNDDTTLNNVSDLFKNIVIDIGLIASAWSTAWNSDTGTDYIQSVFDLLNMVLGLLNSIHEAFQKAWNDDGKGTELITNLTTSLTGINDMIATIGQSFSDAWSEGSGEIIFSNILSSLSNILLTIKKIARKFKEAWQKSGGEKVATTLIGIFTDVSDTIDKITAALSKFGDEVDFSGAVESLDKLLTPLRELTGTLSDDLTKFITDFVVPISTWTINEGLPSALNLIGSALGFINKVLTGLNPILQSLFDNIIKPIVTFIEKLATDIMDELSPLLDGLGTDLGELFTELQPIINWILEKISPALTYFLNNIKQTIMDVIGIVAAKLRLIVKTAKNVIKFIKSVFTGDWEGAWKAISDIFWDVVDYIKTTFEKVIDLIWQSLTQWWGTVFTFLGGIWDDIKGVFAGVGEWFQGIFDDAVKLIKGAWDGIAQFFTNIWNNIKEAFGKVGEWFQTTFTNGWTKVKEAFSGVKDWFEKNVWNKITEAFGNIADWFKTKFEAAWTNIKNAFSETATFFSNMYNTVKQKFEDFGSKIGTAVGDATKVAINGALAAIEGAINAIPKAINGAIDLINKLPGVNISAIPEVTLPRLASGGLAYAPTVAMVGDNKNASVDPEVIAPLSKLSGMLEQSLDIDEIIKLLLKIIDKIPDFTKFNKGVYSGLSKYAIASYGIPSTLSDTAAISSLYRGVEPTQGIGYDGIKSALLSAIQDSGITGGNITIPVYIGTEKIDTIIVNSNRRRNIRNNGRG